MKELNEDMIKRLERRRKLNIEQINKCLESVDDNNLKLIKEEAKDLCGNYVNFFGCHYGYLIGATCGHDDYYWIHIKKDLTIGFSSCVSNPTKLDEMPNIDFSVLEWLIQNEPQSLVDKVKETLKRYDDVFFTPLYINGKEYEIGEIV